MQHLRKAEGVAKTQIVDSIPMINQVRVKKLYHSGLSNFFISFLQQAVNLAMVTGSYSTN